jgi:hypothetical protein
MQSVQAIAVTATYGKVCNTCKHSYVFGVAQCWQACQGSDLDASSAVQVCERITHATHVQCGMVCAAAYTCFLTVYTVYACVSDYDHSSNIKIY